MAHKILIIEGDKNITLALAVRLRAAGYDVLAAPDAVLGMSLAVKHSPALIVLGSWIPGGHGFQVAEWLQNVETMIGVPLIFLTASAPPGLRKRAQRLGAVGCFEKPYDMGELLATIRETLEAPAGAWALCESMIPRWIIPETFVLPAVLGVTGAPAPA